MARPRKSLVASNNRENKSNHKTRMIISWVVFVLVLLDAIVMRQSILPTIIMVGGFLVVALAFTIPGKKVTQILRKFHLAGGRRRRRR